MRNAIKYTNKCTVCSSTFSTVTENRCYCRKCSKLKTKKSKQKGVCINCKTFYTFNKKSSKYCSTKCSNDFKSKSGVHSEFRRSSVKNTLLSVLWGARARSKRRKVECTVSDEFILQLLEKQSGKCALTGITMEPSKQDGFKDKNPFTVSIDRIDNTKGYVEDNVHLVCTIVNLCKNSYNINDVTKMCKEYVKYNNIKINEQ